MAARVRLSQGGKQRTVYVEHGVFYDDETKSIHVTIPGTGTMHRSYSKTGAPRLYEIYKAILVENDRWPDGVD